MVNTNIKGFDFYTAKDLEMAHQADIGFMIWNGKSKGTFNNMLNLLKFEKQVILYYLPTKKFYCLNTQDELNNFLKLNVCLSSKLKQLMPTNVSVQYSQSSLF